MKIVHIFWSFTIGGAETMLVDIMNFQVNTNDITLIIINNNYSKELITSLDKRINIVLIKRKISHKNPIPFLYLNFKLITLKPDIIHCHNYNLEKVLLNSLLKKTIVTIHGFYRPISKNNKYAYVVAISKSIQKDLIKKGLTNTILVYNGIDIDKIERKISFNKELRIVCIGRLEHTIKGQDILIRAFGLLHNINKRATLNFIGDGSSKNYLLDLVSELKLNKSVFFHKAIPRNKLYQIIKDFDILVQPSIHEGFGLTVVEAMAVGLPVIISNASGLVEITANKELGYVIKNNSPFEYYVVLQDLIDKILLNNDEIKTRIKKARRYATKNFTIASTCSNYYKIYCNL